MPLKPSKNGSSATSASDDLGNIYDLNLPVVKPGEELLPPKPPSFKQMMEHATMIIRMFGRPSAAERAKLMNPEPFRM